MTTPREYAKSRFEHHLADGTTWIGIYENKALDSARAGHRIALFYGLDQWDVTSIGDRAPDMRGRVGWRYRLVHKARTVEDALDNMNFSAVFPLKEG